MSDELPSPSDRRGFLTRTAGTAAMAALGALPGHSGAAPAHAPEVDTRKGWLEGVTTPYRQFFETATIDSAVPLLHVANYFEAWRATSGVAPADVTAVVGVFGTAVPLVFSDPIWRKYEIGKALNLVDKATGLPYVRNPYLAPIDGELRATAASTPAALQRLGARLIVCNNALGAWVGRVAAATNQQVPAVRAEWLAEMVPGAMLVPSMVQAVEQAQRAGLTYIKNS